MAWREGRPAGHEALEDDGAIDVAVRHGAVSAPHAHASVPALSTFPVHRRLAAVSQGKNTAGVHGVRQNS